MFIKNLEVCANCTVKAFLRQFHTHRIYYSKPNFKYKHLEGDALEKLIEKHQTKIIYNSFIDSNFPSLTFKNNFILHKRLEQKEKKQRLKLQSVEPLPVVLKYLSQNQEASEEEEHVTAVQEPSITHFPFENKSAVSVLNSSNQQSVNADTENPADTADKEVKTRQQMYNELDSSNWMTDYENFDDVHRELEDDDRWKVNYGTPDPKSSISNVPCGGCGALLHCRDSAIPGYIPSEIYKNSRRREGAHLKALICQRCHFLKHYNLALQVRVSSEDYPKVLKTIKEKWALIILIVDLLDLPCSIYPGILNILGPKKPVIVVGNKIDLLPQDSRGYIQRIKENLKETVREAVGPRAANNIKHVALISAKTGWGVEELITKLHNVWSTRGDVYLVGCTNVGKSSLFNSLLQSDFCKVHAVDLVQRATTSPWPGTTLNLLKFPILRPSGWRLYVRTKRLQSINKLQAEEKRLNKLQLRSTKDPKYATLIGHLDRTFDPEQSEADPMDPFSVHGNANASGRVRLGIDDNDPRFAASKWCYDTPGVVQPDQIIHLLTAEELTMTLPRDLIRPKTFGIRLSQTLFIAGLGRLDYVEGVSSIKLTVFCAEDLPITVCNTEDADLVYGEFLGSEVLQVPRGSAERISQWPSLKAADPFKLSAKDDRSSCGDVVLSSAGWISITCDSACEVTVRAWTPEARGIYLRRSLLPYAVALHGHKIRGSPAYESNKFFIPP